MKKLIMLLAGILLSCTLLSAQKSGKDVLYGKNGSVIRGTIIEQIPGESYKIRTADGSIFVFAADEVEKVEFAPAAPKVTYDADGKAIKEKNPAAALVCSLLVPGLGQIVNGDTGLGVGLMLGAAGGIALMTVGMVVSSSSEGAAGFGIVVLGMSAWLGCSLYSIIQAPMAATRYNRLNGFALRGGRTLNLAPDMALTNTVARGTNAAYGMKLSLNF